jgi:hypothetical protein
MMANGEVQTCGREIASAKMSKVGHPRREIPLGFRSLADCRQLGSSGSGMQLFCTEILC